MHHWADFMQNYSPFGSTVVVVMHHWADFMQNYSPFGSTVVVVMHHWVGLYRSIAHFAVFFCGSNAPLGGIYAEL